MISKDALFEELLLVKVAAEEVGQEQPQEWQSEFIPLMKHRIRQAVPFALGTGAGMGLGYLGGHLLAKRVPSQFVQRYSRPIGTLAGGLLAGSAMALRSAKDRISAEEEELLHAIRERNRPRE
jgi:hypothetical protein